MAKTKYDLWRDQALTALSDMSLEEIKAELGRPKYRQIERGIEEFESFSAEYDPLAWTDLSVWGEAATLRILSPTGTPWVDLLDHQEAPNDDLTSCSKLAA